MYTQCSHCQTIFEIDEGTLQAAFGIVECGQCHQRFDALERLANELRDVATDAADRPHAAPAPRLTHTITPAQASGTRRLRVKKIDLPPDADLSAAFIDATAKLEVDIRPEPATWREIELPIAAAAPGHLPATTARVAAAAVATTAAQQPPRLRTERSVVPASAPTPEPSDVEPPELPDTFELFAQLDAEANRAPSSADQAQAPLADAAPAIDAVASTSATAMADSDAAAVDAMPDLPSVAADDATTPAADTTPDTELATLPAEIPQPAPIAAAEPAAPAAPTTPAHYYVPPRHTVLGRELGWIALCLALALLLAGQIAVASRAQLYRTPATRDFAVSLCHSVGCDLPLLHEPAQLEWMSRDIRPLPSTPGALMITGTLRNTAAATQAYPVVVVQMTDIDGSVVAMRRFRPAEYMPSAPTRAAGIAAGATVAVAFEVADPGRGAVSYQFGFE